MKKKDELIKTHYLRYQGAFTIVKYNKKDIIEYGYLLRTSNYQIASTYSLFQQKLI